MIHIDIKVDTEKAEALIEGLPGKAEAVLEVGARHIEAMAKANAPVRTGALRNSIHVWTPEELTKCIGDGVEYGIYQELGTRKMAAHPFLLPALAAEAPNILKAMAQIFK